MCARGQVLLDSLMHLPVVGFLAFNHSSSSDAWMVMAKEGDVDYSRLNSLFASLEPLPLLRTKAIAPERLRALKRLASTDADRKLLELAALDGCSLSQRYAALGSNLNETTKQCQRREEKMDKALATYNACKQLAALQSLSDISARLGRELSEDDVAQEMGRLVELEERLDKMELSQDDLSDGPRISEESDAEIELDIDGVTDEHVESLRGALASSLDSMPLDSLSLAPGAPDCERLASMLGSDWQREVGASLDWETREPPEEESPELCETSLLDEAEALVLQVRAELRAAEGRDPFGAGSGEAEEGGDELFELLSGLDAKRLVAKLVAKRRRQQMSKARESDAIVEARRALAGERGRCAHRLTASHPHPNCRVAPQAQPHHPQPSILKWQVASR